MNRRLALVVVACMIGALLLMAAGPVPEKPIHEFTGTVSCDVVKEGTSDTRDKAHETNWGQKQVCVIKSDHNLAAGKMTLKNEWSEFNKNQQGAGYGVQHFTLKTADGTWEGLQTTRMNNKGVKAVNGVGHGQVAPYVGLKIYYRVSEDGNVHFWVTEHGKDSLHSADHPGG